MEITLNRNGWHKKLQRFVFKTPPHFYNFCPYFWLTIFCFIVTFIFPIVPLIKILCLLGRGIMYLLEGAANLYEKFICLPFWENISKNMPEIDVLKSWYVEVNATWYDRELTPDEASNFDYWSRQGFSDISYKKREAYRKKFDLWKKANPDWEVKLDQIREKQKKVREQFLIDLAKEQAERYIQEQKDAEKEANKAKRKQQTMSAIVKYTKWVAYFLGGIVVLLACFGMYKLALLIYDLILWGIAHFNYPNFILIMKVLGFIVVTALIILLFITIAKKCSDKITVSFWETWIGKPLKWLGKTIGLPLVKGIVYLFGGMGSGFSFLWSYIMTIKKNHCPGINWVEENEK